MPEAIYTGDRPELLRYFDCRERSVLDVGCGFGRMAPHLRKAGATRVVGIEAAPSRARKASRLYDRLIGASVEQALADVLLDDERFDLILLADVLEHLVDPWSTLTTITSECLATGGHVFISVPNVANLAVVKQLLRRGDWRYDESGMFDRTHLRWFGGGTLRKLLERASLRPVIWGGRVGFKLGPVRVSRILNDVSRVPALAIYQYYVVAEQREPLAASVQDIDPAKSGL